MIHENEMITRRQYISVCFLALLSPLIRQLPQLAPLIAGSAGWLAGLAALPVLILFELMMTRLTKKRAEGEGMADIFLRVFGKPVGSAVLLLYALWMVAYAGFVLVGGAERLLTTAYPRGGRNLFILIMGALGVMASLGRARTLARMANILRPLLLATLLLVIFAAFPYSRLGTLFPVTVQDIPPVFNAGVRTANVLLLVVAFRFLEDRVETSKTGKRALPFLRLFLLLAVLSTLLLAAILANFGAAYTLRHTYPFFAMAGNIRLLGSLERLEVPILALWAFTDFVLLAALLLSAATIFRRVLHSESRLIALFCALGATIAALVCSLTNLDLSLLAETVFPLSGAICIFGLYPLTFLVGLIRKKI